MTILAQTQNHSKLLTTAAGFDLALASVGAVVCILSISACSVAVRLVKQKDIGVRDLSTSEGIE